MLYTLIYSYRPVRISGNTISYLTYTLIYSYRPVRISVAFKGTDFKMIRLLTFRSPEVPRGFWGILQ